MHQPQEVPHQPAYPPPLFKMVPHQPAYPPPLFKKPNQPQTAPPLHILKAKSVPWWLWEEEAAAWADGFGTPDPSNKNDDDQVNQRAAKQRRMMATLVAKKADATPDPSNQNDDTLIAESVMDLFQINAGTVDNMALVPDEDL